MDYTKTYCNPTPLPDYPVGRKCYTDTVREDFRETADPSVIYNGGKWYLYPSCGMVWWTEDFIHWQHKHMEPYDTGYAPTVVKHKGKYLLTACSSDLKMSDSPTGPFVSVGAFQAPDGQEVRVDDPMLYSDTDGRLYLYCGCGGGIKGAELDADNPTRLKTELLTMFEMDTKNHLWERMGDWNEDGSYSWVEGAWMYKRGDIYYLTYCGPGTEWISYAMGAYKSKSPLGPWEYMKTSPFMSRRDGLVRGPGHGCIVDGPNGTVWAFYTCVVCYAHEFERRIGYDPIGFDEEGNIIPTQSTENPQWAPGLIPEPWKGNGAGIIPLTQHRRCKASSCAPGRSAVYGIDDSMLSWWQPADDDADPVLEVFLSDEGLELCSARIIWRDVGMDIKKGIFAGAFQYKIEARTMDDRWVCVLDKSENREDLCIDYNPVQVLRAKAVRLRICGAPEGISPGVINFSVFGSWLPDTDTPQQ